MSGDTRSEPFGGPQIAAVAEVVWGRQKYAPSLEDDPIHPLGEEIEDASKANNKSSQDVHREPAD